MAELFELGELSLWLQQRAHRPLPKIDMETEARVRRHASGWLQSATRLAPWPPNPIPDDLWAWAIELAAIALRNPDGTASETNGDYTHATDRMRRVEILAAARTAYGGSSTPRASFPEPDWTWSAVVTTTGE